MIGPASEVKLSDLSDFMNAPLPFPVSTRQEENKGKHMMSNQESTGYPPAVSKPRDRPWVAGKKVILRFYTHFENLIIGRKILRWKGR